MDNCDRMFPMADVSQVSNLALSSDSQINFDLTLHRSLLLYHVAQTSSQGRHVNRSNLGKIVLESEL